MFDGVGRVKLLMPWPVSCMQTELSLSALPACSVLCCAGWLVSGHLCGLRACAQYCTSGVLATNSTVLECRFFFVVAVLDCALQTRLCDLQTVGALAEASRGSCCS